MKKSHQILDFNYKYTISVRLYDTFLYYAYVYSDSLGSSLRKCTKRQTYKTHAIFSTLIAQTLKTEAC